MLVLYFGFIFGFGFGFGFGFNMYIWVDEEVWDKKLEEVGSEDSNN